MPKRADIILILSIFAAAAVALAVLPVLSEDGKTVSIMQNNELVYEEPLKKDAEINLPGNTVIIKDGCAYMKSADCKNQSCVHSGKISKKGESIICLPNRLTVEISD